jgi:predicted amidophosphoribosyltransferase
LLAPVGPPWCGQCGAPTVWPVPACRECGPRRLGFATARAAVCYTGSARRLVSAWKEHGLRRFAPLAAELVAERVPRPAADAVAYIPPDGYRSVRRGHHPARELAAALAERWQLPLEDLLVRTRPVARQAGLDRAARRANVRGAFASVHAGATAKPARGVILVDDVYTTGATVDAAATALRAAGAAEVHVVTFARVTRGVR